jgi:hypothetical protein
MRHASSPLRFEPELDQAADGFGRLISEGTLKFQGSQIVPPPNIWRGFAFFRSVYGRD